MEVSIAQALDRTSKVMTDLGFLEWSESIAADAAIMQSCDTRSENRVFQSLYEIALETHIKIR